MQFEQLRTDRCCVTPLQHHHHYDQFGHYHQSKNHLDHQTLKKLQFEQLRTARCCVTQLQHHHHYSYKYDYHHWKSRSPNTSKIAI